ncbi:MAG: nucleoside:proton symporter [Desulfobacteraceae bacterium]|nr:MAG: nucleoside:proton symporter [Desulfobacteraceae bacterium]
MEVVRGFFGLIALVALALALSENRRQVAWKTVAAALVLQVALALILLKLPGARQLFMVLNLIVSALEQATQAGTSFVFGYLGGSAPPFAVSPGANTYILAFRGLPLVLVASALSSLLFYWKILPLIVRGFAWLLRRSLGMGGAEGLAAAANVFLGMVEAPLFVRPYLEKLSRGEIFTIMTCGMATIAGTVMVLYASILGPVIPDALGHLLIASIISAPASVAVARVMVPAIHGLSEDALPQAPVQVSSAMEAITAGTMEGVKLLLNIVALLIVLVGLVHLVNLLLGLIPAVNGQPLTLERVLGWGMSPVVWVIGIPWEECLAAGKLMGTKTVLNELLAYLDLARMPAESLSPRSRLIMIYAMCGFANFGSLGIMIGGMGQMAPSRRTEIVSLGLKSIAAGTLAACMTGAVVGMFY